MNDDDDKIMTAKDFAIGDEFTTPAGRWRVTDVGSRVVVAINTTGGTIRSTDPARDGASQADDPSWLNGPPYAVPEVVFDEYLLDGIEPEDFHPKARDDLSRLGYSSAVREFLAKTEQRIAPGPDAARSQDFLYDEDGLPK